MVTSSPASTLANGMPSNESTGAKTSAVPVANSAMVTANAATLTGKFPSR